MRRLVQPGPAPDQRIESFAAEGRQMSFSLRPGVSLNEALTSPLVAAGMLGGTVTFSGGVLAPFVYVVPARPRDNRHVAYFSEPRAPGESSVRIANATFGWRDGEPFVHCHGTWTEPDGKLRGGHMMPHETFVRATAEVHGWGFPGLRIATAVDSETNFTLFRPIAPENRKDGRFVVASVRPNEDICAALEAVCRLHGIGAAVVRGSLGSLVGARFIGGAEVTDHATEVLVRSGRVDTMPDGELRAEIDMLVVDMQGVVHEGRLVRGDNPVCITFELVLEAVG